MIELDDIINNLCPEGVPYKLLGEVAQIGTGSSNGNEAEESGDYPFFIRSQSIKTKNTYEYDEEAIIIPGEGGIGDIFHYINGKYALHQRVYRIHFIDEQINARFVFYYMKAFFKMFILRKAVSATVTSIRKPMVESFPIPIPSIRVQDEIVRVLDNFTELTAELTAKVAEELSVRKKQYKYYLNYLINSNACNSDEYIRLGELFDFRNGLSKGKEFFGKGSPIIRYTDVYNKRFLRSKDVIALVECNDKELKTLHVSRGDVLFTRTSETAEEVGFASVMLDDMKDCVFNGFTIKATPKTDKLLPEYCAYCFSTTEFRDYVTRKCTFTTRASLTGKTLSEFLIEIPCIEKQAWIVDILDRFTSLYNDICISLTAEIEARQKQYEYYRDKLLTFKEFS